MRRSFFAITGTSPAAASTAIVGSVIPGLSVFDWFTIDAQLIGATGGTLDVYLQRQVALATDVAGGVWADWLHFTQLGAGAAAVNYSLQSGPGTTTTIASVASGTDASAGTPSLSAGSFAGGHAGQALRCVCVAGASTSAGAAVKIYVNAFRVTR